MDYYCYQDQSYLHLLLQLKIECLHRNHHLIREDQLPSSILAHGLIVLTTFVATGPEHFESMYCF